MYWIPVVTLRKFVSKLVNLEVLYAIKTSLSVTSKDIEIYNTTKIEKLGITLRKNDEIGFCKAINIKTLYINIIQKISMLTPLIMEMHFPQLKNLWIDLEEPGSGYPIFNYLHADYKYKIFCIINAPIPSLNFDFAGLRRYYNNRRASQFYVMCCEDFSTRDLTINPKIEAEANIRQAWKTLDELHCPVPYGPHDARRLFLNEASLYDISFQELNFHHTGPTCLGRCREAYKDILKSSSAQTIKQLCVKNCLLSNDERNSANQHQANGFKRRRVGVVQSVENHSVEDIFNNFLQLQHLEIFHCPQTFHASSIQAYPLICKFLQLQTLVLEVPVTVDGSFLIHVLKTCSKLECLKITSLAQHENLNMYLSNALPHACALTDLRYENYSIPMDKLIERLGLIKSQKLQRLVLICTEIDKFSADPLKQFLDFNPQLTFLYLLIRQATENSLKMAQGTLNMYKKTRPSKVYLAKKSQIGDIGYPIPLVHFSEIMKFDSTVATLRPLEDFLYF